jgi:hypothetical protein
MTTRIKETKTPLTHGGKQHKHRRLRQQPEPTMDIHKPKDNWVYLKLAGMD